MISKKFEKQSFIFSLISKTRERRLKIGKKIRTCVTTIKIYWLHDGINFSQQNQDIVQNRFATYCTVLYYTAVEDNVIIKIKS